jgi:hypothetical protein
VTVFTPLLQLYEGTPDPGELPDASSVAVEPGQIGCGGPASATGIAFTVTVALALLEHPPPLAVTVTVYVVVVVGIGLAVALDSPSLQVYVPPPVALIVAVCPAQIISEVVVMVTGLTLITVVTVTSQAVPVAGVHTHVYVCPLYVPALRRLTTCPEVADNPVEGLHA